jgi:TetR/AcrR family transcriptional repressor of nem operon
LDILAIEISGSNKKVAKVVDRIFEERKVIYANCIREGQELGEIRNDESAEDLAEFLLTGYSGAQLKAKTEKSIRPMEIFANQYIKYVKTLV